jgi:hypothetical protein
MTKAVSFQPFKNRIIIVRMPSQSGSEKKPSKDDAKRPKKSWMSG